MAPISHVEIRRNLLDAVAFQKMSFRQKISYGHMILLTILSWYTVKCREEYNILSCESIQSYNQSFSVPWVQVCLQSNSRLPLFWRSPAQCLEPMYAQLLSESKHRHRLEQHGDLRRR